MFSEYYDIYMETSEITVDSTSRLTILKDNGISSLVYPNQLWQNMYHTSSTFIDTGNTFYNFQIRDLFGNIGRTLDSVYYQIITSETNAVFRWPDQIAKLNVGRNSVSTTSNIMLYTDNQYDISYRSNLHKISQNYHVSPYDIEFINKIELGFDVNLESNLDIDKYYIMHYSDNVWIPIYTVRYDYYVAGYIDKGGIYALFYSEDEIELVPDNFEVLNIYPNPFNPTTNIEFSIPSKSHVSINVYNLLGENIKNIADYDFNKGFHVVKWDGLDNRNNSVASGIYFVTIEYGSDLISKKVTLLK